MGKTYLYPNITTVRDLLEAAIESGQLMGEGTDAKVYAFAPRFVGMEDYVLRVDKRVTLDRALRRSTSLTPASSLAAGMHIGQPLMVLDGENRVSILKKQRGESLSHIHRCLSPQTGLGGATGSVALMEQFVAQQKETGKNPFLPLFEQAFVIAHSGFKPDLHLSNILRDPETGALQLVDQLHETRARPHWWTDEVYAQRQMAVNAETILANFEKLCAPEFRDYMDNNKLALFLKRSPIQGEETQALAERYHAAKTVIAQMLSEATRTVALSHMRDREKPKKLTFADVADVKAVALTAPPLALVAQLREIEQKAKLSEHSR